MNMTIVRILSTTYMYSKLVPVCPIANTQILSLPSPAHKSYIIIILWIVHVLQTAIIPLCKLSKTNFKNQHRKRNINSRSLEKVPCPIPKDNRAHSVVAVVPGRAKAIAENTRAMTATTPIRNTATYRQVVFCLGGDILEWNTESSSIRSYLGSSLCVMAAATLNKKCKRLPNGLFYTEFSNRISRGGWLMKGNCHKNIYGA